MGTPEDKQKRARRLKNRVKDWVRKVKKTDERVEVYVRKKKDYQNEQDEE